MSGPLFSIGGLGSGLDTQSIMAQLMQIERQPVFRFQQRQDDLRKVDAAWSSVVSRLGSLRTAADNLRLPNRLAEQVAITTTDESAVTASRTGLPEPGSITFSVERLATKHQVVAGTTPFPAADAVVGEGAFTLRGDDGEALVTIETDGETTLADLARQINRNQSQVNAQVIRTDEGAHRLVLTARESGAANRFTIDTDLANLGAAAEGTTEGQDAHLKVGTLDVYRSSNTVTDLIGGLQIDLRKAEAGTPITINVERDLDGAVEQVKEFVDALNGAMKMLKDVSAAGTGNRGPLSGNSLVRRVAADLRQAMNGIVDGIAGDVRTASALGISVQRDGSFKLDQSRLREVLSEDFDAVAKLFARNGEATDPRVRFTSASERTQAGEHTVEITKAARVAVATGAAWSPPVGEPKTFSITTASGRRVDVIIDADTDVSAAVAKITAALRDANVTNVVAEEVDGALSFRSTQHGSTRGFTIAGTDDPALDGEHWGEDVEGTINGVAATGTGQTLAGTEGAADGLRLRITATPEELALAGGVLALGSVTVTQGLAGRIDGILREATGAGGSIARARNNLTSQIKRFDDRIQSFEDRLAIREKSLRARFTAMESAMAQLSSQGSWMMAQMASLPMGMPS
jgi:flagellar hook-associated protein 2